MVASHRADVLVVGGGPAGSAAAISAARAGLRVILLERGGSSRHRPGETLPPGAEPLFQQLGVWDDVAAAGFIRFPGQRTVRGGATEYRTFGGTDADPWLGIQAWRPVLDAILLRRAAAAGAEVWQPCGALAPIVRGGKVCGASTPRGPVECALVVDASGGTGWLARRLGHPPERRGPRRVAWFGYVESARAPEWLVPELRPAEAGWTWTAQVRPRLLAWTRLCSGAAIAPLGPPDSLRLPDARRVACGRAAADVSWRLASSTAGPGYFLAGDAAATLDPASSHGVLRALMSGMLASHLARGVLDGSLRALAAASAYADWTRRWFEHDAAVLEVAYARFEEGSLREAARNR